MKKLIFIFIILFNIAIFSMIKFQVTGKVVYNGIGIEGISINIFPIENKMIYSREVFSDQNGDFHFYVPPGLYRIFILEQKGYVAKEKETILKIADKNISNVILFLEKECKISGVVRFTDGTPLTGNVFVNNKRCFSDSKIGTDGSFLVSGIKSAEDTVIEFQTNQIIWEKRTGISLKEGDFLKNINLIVPKRLSIEGIVKDMYTKETILGCLIIIRTDKFSIPNFQDKEGVFRFYNLDPGKYKILCSFYNKKTNEYNESLVEFNLNVNEIKKIVIEIDTNSTETKIISLR